MNNAQVIESLKVLKTLANDACRLAVAKRVDVDIAANWADLSCIESRWIVNDGGDESFQVVVSEASPEAFWLQEFIEDRLKEDGFIVEVVTEW